MISRKIKSTRPAVSTEFPPHPGLVPHSPTVSTRPPPGSDPGRDAHGKTAHAGYRRRHHPLADPYLVFWFRFVYLRRAERGGARYHLGGMLEQLICDIASRRILSLRIRGLGRWWQKEVEIREPE